MYEWARWHIVQTWLNLQQHSTTWLSLVKTKSVGSRKQSCNSLILSSFYHVQSILGRLQLGEVKQTQSDAQYWTSTSPRGCRHQSCEKKCFRANVFNLTSHAELWLQIHGSFHNRFIAHRWIHFRPLNAFISSTIFEQRFPRSRYKCGGFGRVFSMLKVRLISHRDCRIVTLL